VKEEAVKGTKIEAQKTRTTKYEED